jgi:cell division protein FtsL
MINKRRNLQNNKLRLNPVIIVSVFLFVASFVGRLYISSLTASKSIELKELYTTRVSLEQEISKLEYESLTLSSLSQIEVNAEKMGFVPFNGLISSIDLDVSHPLALR